MRLEIAQAARADLDEIDSLWIEAAGARVADRISKELAARQMLLVEFLLSGRAIPELGQEVRCIPSGPYLIFYRVLPEMVQILHVRHSARRPIA